MKNTEIKISPSILSGDFADMASAVKNVEKWGGDMVHCDVMDGVFVKNLTFGMPMIKALRKRTNLPLDVHLMIVEPERYINEFIESGADIITFHPEASSDPLQTLKDIRDKGVKAGIVFNPDVEIDRYKDLFFYCDMILVMGVYAGLGGQKFIESTLEKLAKLKNYLKGMKLDIPIEIDGGINEDNVASVIEKGASIIVAGSSVFKSPNPERTIRNLRSHHN
ncbi:MAG: ribulose-phosphate 3-epimerase [Bacillota bacterium]